ncbi:MAG: hypothetical protein OXH96_04705 [Spirochaetaceae bacterium]|nr:hypothetical protein [Spirochaetaceae bacterium]
MLGQQTLDRVTAEGTAELAGKQRSVRAASEFAEPHLEHRDCLDGKRCDAVFASFAVAAYVSATIEMGVTAAQADQFGNPQAGLHSEDEQRMVAPTDACSTIGSCEQRVDLDGGQKAHFGALLSLRRDRKHSLDHVGVLRMAQLGKAKQRMNRDQTGIPGARAVATVMFEMVEKRVDDGHVEIGEKQLRRRLAERGGNESEQQPEGVTVGSYCVGAGLTFADQALREERLESRCQGAHGNPPQACPPPSRWAAVVSNSGTACRYQ